MWSREQKVRLTQKNVSRTLTKAEIEQMTKDFEIYRAPDLEMERSYDAHNQCSISEWA